jgi:glutamate-1-semialdehyde 2,1-aminomutase
VLDHLDADVFAGIERQVQRFATGLRAVEGLKEFLQVTTVGTLMGVFFADAPVRDYNDAKRNHASIYSTVFRHLLDRGVYIAPSPYEAMFVSAAHTDADIDRTLEIVSEIRVAG